MELVLELDSPCLAYEATMVVCFPELVMGAPCKKLNTYVVLNKLNGLRCKMDLIETDEAKVLVK